MTGEIVILLASFVMFSGALGINLFRDSFQRFHAAGKVSLFGLALLILGDAIVYQELAGQWHFFAYIGVILLLFVGPFAAHILAKSLYHSYPNNEEER